MNRAQAWQKVIGIAQGGDPEDLLNAIADYLDLDAAAETNNLVKSCLESAAEHARHAATDYYASTK